MNRNFYLTVLLLISLSSNSNSQIFNNAGIKGGVTYSKFIWEYKLNAPHDDMQIEDGYELGYNFYFYSNFIDKDNWSFGTSIGFIEKASKHSYYWWNSNYGGMGQYKTKLNYISLIPFITGKFPGSSSLKIGASIGPRLDFLVNHSKNLEYYREGFGPFVFKTGDKFKNVVFGLHLSAEIQKTFKKSTIGIEAAYQPSLSYLLNETGGNGDGYQDETSYLKMRDKTFILNLSYSIKFQP